MASILRRVAADDPAAVQESIQEYGDLVWSIARRLLGDADEAEAVTREAFLRMWRDADRFDPQLASERTWVAMLARRRSIDRLRERDRSGRGRESGAGDRRRQGSLEEEAHRAAIALEELPETRSRVLEIAILEGLTYRQIAAAMGIAPDTVRTHVSRGLASVREAVLASGAGQHRG